MLYQRFVRTTPGATALARIGASSTANALVIASIFPHTADYNPSHARTPSSNSGRERDRASITDKGASILHRCQSGPIAHLKETSGLLKIVLASLSNRKVSAAVNTR